MMLFGDPAVCFQYFFLLKGKMSVHWKEWWKEHFYPHVFPIQNIIVFTKPQISFCCTIHSTYQPLINRNGCAGLITLNHNIFSITSWKNYSQVSMLIIHPHMHISSFVPLSRRSSNITIHFFFLRLVIRFFSSRETVCPLSILWRMGFFSRWVSSIVQGRR